MATVFRTLTKNFPNHSDAIYYPAIESHPCHSHVGGNPSDQVVAVLRRWTPAFAGVTEKMQ